MFREYDGGSTGMSGDIGRAERLHSVLRADLTPRRSGVFGERTKEVTTVRYISEAK